MDLVQFLQQQGAAIAAAPLAFLVFFIVAVAAAYGLARLHYSARIATQGERIDQLKDEITSMLRRLEEKDKQLAEYYQRLFQSDPSKATAFSAYSNKQLKERTLRLVGEIREWQTKDPLRQVAYDIPPHKEGMTQEEWGANRERYHSQLAAAMDRHTDEFIRRFKIEALALRDELLTRLPSGIKRIDRIDAYEHPVNSIDARDIVDDLELLATQLPNADT
jgi:uncharacterized protein YdcH (DUF465 family)